MSHFVAPRLDSYLYWVRTLDGLSFFVPDAADRFSAVS